MNFPFLKLNYRNLHYQKIRWNEIQETTRQHQSKINKFNCDLPVSKQKVGI